MSVQYNQRKRQLSLSSDEQESVDNKRIQTDFLATKELFFEPTDSERAYSDLLRKGAELSSGINFFTTSHNLLNNDLKRITNVLQAVDNKLVKVVVLGLQSCGKSSLLNQMIPVLDLTVGSGLATLCPIEIRLSPFYENRIYLIDFKSNSCHYQDEAGKIFSTIKEAHAFVERYVKQQNQGNKKLCTYAKIIKEIKSEKTLIIVDLPGYRVSPNETVKHYDEQFFEYLKDNYLMKPETIILHVAKADTDSSVDFSRKYLIGNPNKIIKVLTHVDKAVDEQADYIRMAIETAVSNEDKVAFVINKENEISQLNGLVSIEDDQSEYVIKGSGNLLDYINTSLREKIKQLLPEQEKTFEFAHEEIMKYLNHQVGRREPDFVEECANFRTYTDKQISDLFNLSGTEYAKAFNSVTKQINPDIIEQFKKIPEISELAKELEEGGGRRQFRGAEGWDTFSKKYISETVNEMRNKLINSFIENYTQTVAQYLKKTLEDGYERPYAKNAKQELVKIAGELLGRLKDDIGREINKLFDKVINDPYVNNDCSVIDDVYKEIEALIDSECQKLENNRNITFTSDQVKHLLRSLGSNISKVTRSNNIYVVNAKYARSQLQSFWKIQFGQMHNSIVAIVKDHERNLETDVKKSIQRIQPGQLCEEDNIKLARQQLLVIEGILEEIYGLI